MKKLSILLCALCFLTSAANAAVAKAEIQPIKKMPAIDKQFKPSVEERAKMRRAHEAAFEQKLGLTEVQKLKAREQRKAGFEKMKPVMEELKAKRQEAEAIRRSKLSVQAQEEKLTAIDKDIQELEKKVAEIRKQNMKDFESILTKSQRKTLKNMKKEGRAKFEHERRVHPQPMPLQKEIK